MERTPDPMMEVVGAGELDRAARALEDGAVVGLPTDTVYGIGARLDRPDAIAAIFAAKGRPEKLALPVLIGSLDDVRQVARTWPAPAAALAVAFWPGSLTLVVPALPAVGRLVGGDGDSVGVRLPDHGVIAALCAQCGPLAVTSANRHGEPPCTTADAVAAALAGTAVTLVVDAGTCDGTPSTVADCTVTPPRLLREGGIAWSRLEAALGKN